MNKQDIINYLRRKIAFTQPIFEYWQKKCDEQMTTFNLEQCHIWAEKIELLKNILKDIGELYGNV